MSATGFERVEFSSMACPNGYTFRRQPPLFLCDLPEGHGGPHEHTETDANGGWAKLIFETGDATHVSDPAELTSFLTR